MEPGRGQKAGDYFTAYSRVSSIQGLKHLGEKNRSKIERIFWALVVLFCLGMCLYLILLITRKYRTQPFITSFDQKATPLYEIPVPAITVCPKPAIDVTKYDICKYVDKMNKGESLTKEEKLAYDVLALTSDPTKTSSTRFFKFNEIHKFLNRAKNNIFTKSRSYCTWYRGNMNCTESWIPILTDMGVCYTFNMVNLDEIYRSDVIKPNINDGIINNLKVRGYDIETSRFDKKAGLETYPRRMWRAGVTFALSISIHLPDNIVEPDCLTDRTIGFKILLHNPAQIPRVKSESLPVGMKRKFMINFEPQVVLTGGSLKNYSPEERECYFSEEKHLRYFKNYNEENCELECMTNLTLKECGCVSFYMPHTNKTAICGLGKSRCAKRILWSHFMDSSLLLWFEEIFTLAEDAL